MAWLFHWEEFVLVIDYSLEVFPSVSSLVSAVVFLFFFLIILLSSLCLNLEVTMPFVCPLGSKFQLSVL